MKRYPFEVGLPDGLPVSGVVLADHVKSVDWVGRNAVYDGTAPADTVAAVLTVVTALLRG